MDKQQINMTDSKFKDQTVPSSAPNELKQQNSSLLNAIKSETKKESKDNSKTEKYHFDKLRMFFGEPFKITDDLIVYQPTRGQILEYGETNFFSLLNVFISHTTQYRQQLQKKGIDQCKISDQQLFASTASQLTLDQTKILFGDFDFYKIKQVPIPLSQSEIVENEEHKNDKHFKKHKPTFMLLNIDKQLVMTEDMYLMLAEYLRTMFNIFPKDEHVRGKSLREEVILTEQLELSQKKDEENPSFLLPLISACTNHPGFKYKLQELKEVGICQFMDSVQRLQVYESTVALNHGAYSGFADLSKVDKENFNFMRDLSRNNK